MAAISYSLGKVNCNLTFLLRLDCIAGSFGVAMGSSALLPLAKVRTIARPKLTWYAAARNLRKQVK